MYHSVSYGYVDTSFFHLSFMRAWQPSTPSKKKSWSSSKMKSLYTNALERRSASFLKGALLAGWIRFHWDIITHFSKNGVAGLNRFQVWLGAKVFLFQSCWNREDFIVPHTVLCTKVGCAQFGHYEISDTFARLLDWIGLGCQDRAESSACSRWNVSE